MAWRKRGTNVLREWRVCRALDFCATGRLKRFALSCRIGACGAAFVAAFVVRLIMSDANIAGRLLNLVPTPIP
jgi:preprotein translocase subunit SecD